MAWRPKRGFAPSGVGPISREANSSRNRLDDADRGLGGDDLPEPVAGFVEQLRVFFLGSLLSALGVHQHHYIQELREMHNVSFRNYGLDELYFGFGIGTLAVAEDFETARLVPIVDDVVLKWKAHQALAKRFQRAEAACLTPDELRALRSLGYIR